MDELPKLKAPKFRFPRFWQNQIFWLVVLTVFISTIFGFVFGTISGNYFYSEIRDELSKFNIQLPELKISEKEKIVEKEPIYLPQTSQEEAVIKAVKEVSPAVVSIIVTKDVPKLKLYYEDPFKEFEQFFGQPFEFEVPQYKQEGTEKKEIGGGTGFIVSEDGMILTNGHVVSDKEAEYTVLTNDGKKYPAKVLARDSIRDLALIKIENQ